MLRVLSVQYESPPLEFPTMPGSGPLDVPPQIDFIDFEEEVDIDQDVNGKAIMFATGEQPAPARSAIDAGDFNSAKRRVGQSCDHQRLSDESEQRFLLRQPAWHAAHAPS